MCVCDSRSGWVHKGLWEIQNPQIAEFGRHDPTPTPISCLNCLSVSWAPFHSTAVFFSCPQSCGRMWESAPRTSLSSRVNNDRGSLCDHALQCLIPALRSLMGAFESSLLEDARFNLVVIKVNISFTLRYKYYCQQ